MLHDPVATCQARSYALVEAPGPVAGKNWPSLEAVRPVPQKPAIGSADLNLLAERNLVRRLALRGRRGRVPTRPRSASRSPPGISEGPQTLGNPAAGG